MLGGFCGYIYRNRENLRYCKERGIRLSGPALERPKKGEERNKVQDYQDKCERVEVERKFSLRMWSGSGDGEAGRYSCACGCSVHSAAESAKDSVRFFTISGLAARLFATVRRTEGCSVDITYKVMSIGTRDIDKVYFFRGEDGINVFLRMSFK